MDQLDFNEEELSILKQKLEVGRLKKEIEGLTLNNAQLEKEWYRKPQWIAALSPIVIGIFTLIVAWASGFLQAQNTLNKIQQEAFSRKKDSIDHVINHSIFVQDSLSILNATLTAKNIVYDSTTRQINEFLKISQDSFKTVDQKQKYFSNKLLSLQRENDRLKLENYGLYLRLYPFRTYSSVLDSNIKVSDSDIIEFFNRHKRDSSLPFVDFK